MRSGCNWHRAASLETTIRKDTIPGVRWLAAGSVSLKVFPAVGLVGLSCREAICEGDGERVSAGFHRMVQRAWPVRGEGPGDQVEAL